MNTSKLAGLVYYSPRPVALADFYRETLGVPLAPTAHGTVGNHIEGLFGDIHVAIWDEQQGHGVSPLVPSFRCSALTQVSDTAVRMGAKQLHRPIDLGEGKRVVTLLDPDGRAFRLIEFAHS
jgi:predicted enzyme related to lactoylglutathione lyase